MAGSNILLTSHSTLSVTSTSSPLKLSPSGNESIAYSFKKGMLCRSGVHWYQFDDARVTLVPEQHVRTSNAYMLFYLQQ